MTSATEGKAPAPPPPPPSAEERRRSPLDQLPPPANSSKPLTPFSIEDILSKPSCGRRAAANAASAARLLDKGAAAAAAAAAAAGSTGPARNGVPAPASPLCALEELASKTFKGLEVNVLQAAEGRDPLGAFGPRPPSKKRRKSRTAFTNHQIYELEKRFLYQKYLSPADRDHIAAQLGLSNAQVITWFQNRRAKLKRDLEEMKADVESLKKLPPAALEKLASMPELEPPAPAHHHQQQQQQQQRQKEEEVSAPQQQRQQQQQAAAAGSRARTPGSSSGDSLARPPSPRSRDAFSDGEEGGEEEEEEEEDEEEEEEEEIDVGD